MTSFAPIIPLFITAALLLAGNGLIGTLVSLRAEAEGIPTTLIGLIGTAYFAGFTLACFLSPRLIYKIGHIRFFSALAALAASATLVMLVYIDITVWFFARVAMGFCFSGLFTVVESWLNEKSSNESRARVISIYRLVDLSAVTASQYLIISFDITHYALFCFAAILFCLSLVPISLTPNADPPLPDNIPFNLKAVWRISPLACFGSFTIGLTNSAFRVIGPLYGKEIGLDTFGVASFLSAGIIGGAVLQYPLGVLSDKAGRRIAVIVATTGAVFAGLFLTFFARYHPAFPFIGAFIFGTFALPLYSLSAAHANDQAKKGQYVLIAAGLSFFFAIGATIGPTVSSIAIESYGPQMLFVYTSIMHSGLIIFTLARYFLRPIVHIQHHSRFVALLRTSPAFFLLARQNKTNENSKED